MIFTTDKPIKRFVFGLHENRTNLEVVAVVFNDESNEKIPLTVESLAWAAELVKTQGVKVNNENRLTWLIRKFGINFFTPRKANSFLIS